MNVKELTVILVIILILTFSIISIIKMKKRGIKCIGCNQYCNNKKKDNKIKNRIHCSVYYS